MNRTQLLQRNILLYRLNLIFGANGFITSAIFFFYTSIKSFSPGEALFLVGLVALTVSLAEVPTGVIADKFSRKYSQLIGYVLIALSWIGVLLATNFWLVALFTIGRGIGGSFTSGADDALLYDSLQEQGKADKFKQVYNLSASIELIAFAITVFIGGVLASINLYFPIAANIAGLVLSIIFTSLFTEPALSKQGEALKHVGYLTHTIRSIKTVFSKEGFISGLLIAFVALALISAVFKSTKNILTPVLDDYGFSMSIIGLVISGIILIKALGAFIASKVNKKGNEHKEIIFCMIFCVAGLLAITFIQVPLLQLIIFILIISLDYVILVNLKTIVNESIESHERSTILSLLSLFARSTEMLFLTSFGWMIDLYPYRVALLFTAGWLGIVTTLLLIFNRK